MLNFLKKRSYDLVTMFVTQIALSIFGLALSLAVPTTQPTLRIVTSVFSVLFYLFLIYTKVWDLGYKDMKALNRGDAGYSRLEGLYLGIGASSVNFIVAILNTLIYIHKNDITSGMSGVSRIITLLTEGMYTGILATKINGVELFKFAPMYFAILIPLIITSMIAYYAGSKDFKLFSPRKGKN